LFVVDTVAALVPAVAVAARPPVANTIAASSMSTAEDWGLIVLRPSLCRPLQEWYTDTRRSLGESSSHDYCYLM
jgi:hypothetical protein